MLNKINFKNKNFSKKALKEVVYEAFTNFGIEKTTKLSDEMKEVVVAKHNIDEEPNTPTKFGVRGIPTMLLFKDGELASTKVGATTKSNIQDWIKENL